MSQRDYLIVECDNGRTLNSPAMGRCGRCDADLEGLRVEPRSEWNQRRDAESAADPAETLAQDHVPAAFRDALRDALVEYGECAFCGCDGITRCDCELRDPLQREILTACIEAFGGWER